MLIVAKVAVWLEAPAPLFKIKLPAWAVVPTVVLAPWTLKVPVKLAVVLMV